MILDLQQGSPEWIAARAKYDCASDAPAMMGCSPYKTRAQLLRDKHTGLPADIDTATHMRFANGHRVEALARPLAEEFIGEPLYPVTCVSGNMLASMDGLTMEEREAFEHKALNDELRAIFKSAAESMEGRLLPIYHRVQMEQQLLVSGAERVLFMCSAWTADEDLIEEHHCWYYPDMELRQQIIDGWRQFHADLAAYELPPVVEASPVGKAPQTLPALRIEVQGKVTASNLAEFKQTALSAIRSVNRDLRTDSDFADAEKAVKWCGEVESRLTAAKEHALSQTADIDLLFKTIDDIAAESKRVRLDLDKLVTRRKTEVKESAIVKARRALDEHVARLNAEIAPIRLGPVDADFAAAIKGLRTVASMQDRLDVVLSGAKIAADIDARMLRENLLLFKEECVGHEFLFSDLSVIVHKPRDDFARLIEARINGQKMIEAAKERQRQAQEAQRIAVAEQRAREQEAARIAELQRQQAEEAARQAATALQTAAQPSTPAVAAAAAPAASQTAPGPILHAAAPAPRPNEPAALSLGAICGRLGFTVSAQFLADALHVAPAKTDKRALLFSESQYQTICRQLISHVGAMAELYAGEVTA